MKVLKVLSLVILLLGCDASEKSLLGQLGKDFPAITKAEIIMSGSEGVMNIELREGISLQDIHAMVNVEEIPGSYKITSQDGSIRLSFLQSHAFSNLYACSDCATFHQIYLPVFWNLK